MAKDPWVAELIDEKLYRESNAVSGRLSQLGINPLDINYVLTREVKRGFFDRQGLYEVVLLNKDREQIGVLFAKVNKMGGENLPKWVEQSHGQNTNSYQAIQLGFCNTHKLPVVECVGYIGGITKGYSTLLMRKINAPTLDRDILAIDQLIEKRRERKEGVYRTLEEEAKLGREIVFLSELRKDLIESALGAVNNFVVYGTSFALSPDEKTQEIDETVKEITQTHEKDYYISKTWYRLGLTLDRFLLNAGSFTMDDIRGRKSWYMEEHNRLLGGFLTALRPHFGLIEGLHRDPRFHAYVHGDEHLHHIYFESNGDVFGNKIDNLGTSARFFDLSLCMFGSSLRSKAALLASPLLNLKVEEIKKFFLESHTDIGNIARRLAEDPKRKEGLTSLLSGIDDDAAALKTFSFISIIELLNKLGLIARDQMHNTHFMEQVDRSFNYKPSIYPLFEYFKGDDETDETVPLKKYHPDNTFKIVRRALEDRIGFVLDKSNLRLTGPEFGFVDTVRKVLDGLDSLSKRGKMESNVPKIKTPVFLAETREVPSVS